MVYRVDSYAMHPAVHGPRGCGKKCVLKFAARMANCEVRVIPNVKLNSDHAASESLKSWLKQAFIDAVVSQKRVLLLIPSLDAMHPLAWLLISSLLAPNSMPNILTPEEERAVIGESSVHVGASRMVSNLGCSHIHVCTHRALPSQLVHATRI